LVLPSLRNLHFIAEQFKATLLGPDYLINVSMFRKLKTPF
jgi:hypothetical protein